MWRSIYLFLCVRVLYQLRILDILMIFEGYELKVARGTSIVSTYQSAAFLSLSDTYKPGKIPK